jgi:hypothetical protein
MMMMPLLLRERRIIIKERLNMRSSYLSLTVFITDKIPLGGENTLA